jgi:hypothetical protein
MNMNEACRRSIQTVFRVSYTHFLLLLFLPIFDILLSLKNKNNKTRLFVYTYKKSDKTEDMFSLGGWGAKTTTENATTTTTTIG